MNDIKDNRPEGEKKPRPWSRMSVFHIIGALLIIFLTISIIQSMGTR